MGDFDDDLDAILTQQCLSDEATTEVETAVAAGDGGHADDILAAATSCDAACSPTKNNQLKRKLEQLESENECLKNEVCFLRNKAERDCNVADAKQKQLKSVVEKCQKDIEKLKSELEFKRHEAAASNNTCSTVRSSMSSTDVNNSFKRNASSVSTTALAKQQSTSTSHHVNEMEDEYDLKKPTLQCEGGGFLKLSKEERQKRYLFFQNTFKPYKPPEAQTIE